MAEDMSTPRISAEYLSAFQNQVVRIVGKVTQLRGETAVVDAGGAITVYLTRVCCVCFFIVFFSSVPYGQSGVHRSFRTVCHSWASSLGELASSSALSGWRADRPSSLVNSRESLRCIIIIPLVALELLEVPFYLFLPSHCMLNWIDISIDRSISEIYISSLSLLPEYLKQKTERGKKHMNRRRDTTSKEIPSKNEMKKRKILDPTTAETQTDRRLIFK